jgi:uncharacterized membrane protein
VDVYLIVKTLHVLSATVLFGTGAGIAFLMLKGQASSDPAARRFAASTTVNADMLFTLPAVIIQPLSGAWLVWQGGFDWTDRWLVLSYGLYLLAGLCWLPVVAIQIRIKRLLDRQAAGLEVDAIVLTRLLRWWFALGWPAFGGLVVIFYLMVAKPSW